MAADEDIAVTAAIRIPRSEFSFQFSRSGGPGGQNVNKVSSRVQLRWNIAASSALPEEVKERLASHNRRRINAEGELLITSSRYRDQPKNIEDCRDKLRELVLAALRPPKPRKPTKPTAGSHRRRLQSKRERADRKSSRKPPSLNNE